MGRQTRYAVTASFLPATGSQQVVSDSRLIGFRTFALVTGNDTDPSTLAGVDGSGNFTMRFKVNGANMWSRGANMVRQLLVFVGVLQPTKFKADSHGGDGGPLIGCCVSPARAHCR
jgi:hypothetical protein